MWFVNSIFGDVKSRRILKTNDIINHMTAQDWAGFILTLFSISAIILGGIRWYITIQVKPIAESVEDIRKETKTNGGTSMRDEIKQIKVEQENARDKRKATSDKLDHMYDILLEYVSKNSK